MIEYKLKFEICEFDGRIIKRYRWDGKSMQFHIDWVKTVEIESDRKGRKHDLIYTVSHSTIDDYTGPINHFCFSGCEK